MSAVIKWGIVQVVKKFEFIELDFDCFLIIFISPLDCLQWSWARSWKIMYYSGVQRKKNNGNYYYYFVVRLTV